MWHILAYCHETARSVPPSRETTFDRVLPAVLFLTDSKVKTPRCGYTREWHVALHCAEKERISPHIFPSTDDIRLVMPPNRTAIARALPQKTREIGRWTRAPGIICFASGPISSRNAQQLFWTARRRKLPRPCYWVLHRLGSAPFENMHGASVNVGEKTVTRYRIV
jgi:hypothetical protein